MSKNMYPKFSYMPLEKSLVESKAWNELTRKEINIFTYLYSCLQWTWNKKKTKYEALNNGDIEVSSIKMGKKLGISKQTASKGIHKLIKVGFTSLTRVGENKTCHMYKILYKAVPSFQERWRKYPEQNWESECPKAPNKLVGKDTRFKSHPKKVDLNSNIQESLDDLDIDISKVKLTE